VERAAAVYELLEAEYPEAHCELDHQDPYQLAVATILSAQTTDEGVNRVTPTLFRRYPDAQALANAQQADIEEIIRTTGFFRNKAKNIIGFARAVVAGHEGNVPRTMAELSALPGVGRKTANVILGNAFGIDEGVVVDTHVNRLSNRLRFTREETPEKIEQDLMSLFPREQWTLLAHLLIWHGRRVCEARRPRCEACVVSHLCPSSRV
jgi:endonuclease-3